MPMLYLHIWLLLSIDVLISGQPLRFGKVAEKWFPMHGYDKHYQWCGILVKRILFLHLLETG